MSDTVIRVENLSKSYTIRHQSGERYTALRDVLANGAKTLGSRLLRPASSHQPAATSEEFWALNDVSFEVKQGERVGIIGRNGAGKSTLLKILSRITEPTKGRIHIKGRVASLLEVGTGFHPELTGRENIYLNGAILGMSREEIRRKFDEIVAFAEVEKFLDTPVKRYSSGMYVRLAFAVAAHLEPEILVVDEVLAVGDTEFQKKCLGKMKDVSTTGRTILFVSHNMGAIQQLCSRVILLRDGDIIEDSTPDKAIMKYLINTKSYKEGHFNLVSHPARFKGNFPFIQQVTLQREDGTPTSIFTSGSTMIVEIEILPDKPIREPRLAIAIEDNYGRRITTMASYFDVQTLPAITNRCVTKCTVPNLNIGNGHYLLSVSIADKYNGLLDSLDCVIGFEVEWNNNYGNGESYLDIYGPVLSKSCWQIKENTHC